MTQDNAITLYKWILQEFTIEGRAEFVTYLGPHLAALVHPQDRVLDLCCGAGPFSFLLEEQGAQVTAIDFAPNMIQLAQEAALNRRSAVKFIQADILTQDLGSAQFDLVVFLGNTVSDFPMTYPVTLPHESGPDGEPRVIHRMTYNASGNPSSFALGSVADLANLARMYLNQGRFGDQQFLTASSGLD